MKRSISVCLVLALLLGALAIPASALTINQVRSADAMNDLGLFLGTDIGYELENKLTRAQGVTMLVRMIGKEPVAKNGSFGDPFKDVDAWAKGYVGYAWKNQITNGISANEFGPNMTMTDYMFLTLTLRALGYNDSQGDFVWNDPYTLAKKVGLISSTTADKDFTRGEAVEVFWNAMNAKLKDKTTTLADSLIAQGIFTAEEFAAAAKVQKDGRKEYEGQPLNPDTGKPAEGVKPEVGTEEEQPEEKPGTSGETTYEDYQNMSAEEQKAFMNSFKSMDDFFTWFNAARKKAEEGYIEIGGDGTVDLGDILNGNNG